MRPAPTALRAHLLGPPALADGRWGARAAQVPDTALHGPARHRPAPAALWGERRGLAPAGAGASGPARAPGGAQLRPRWTLGHCLARHPGYIGLDLDRTAFHVSSSRCSRPIRYTRRRGPTPFTARRPRVEMNSSDPSVTCNYPPLPTSGASRRKVWEYRGPSSTPESGSSVLNSGL